MSLFQDQENKHRQLEDLAQGLLKLSSLLGLHAWYKSDHRGPHPVLKAAADDAEDAARILRGEVQP